MLLKLRQNKIVVFGEWFCVR